MKTTVLNKNRATMFYRVAGATAGPQAIKPYETYTFVVKIENIDLRAKTVEVSRSRSDVGQRWELLEKVNWSVRTPCDAAAA